MLCNRFIKQAILKETDPHQLPEEINRLDQLTRLLSSAAVQGTLHLKDNRQIFISEAICFMQDLSTEVWIMEMRAEKDQTTYWNNGLMLIKKKEVVSSGWVLLFLSNRNLDSSPHCSYVVQQLQKIKQQNLRLWLLLYVHLPSNLHQPFDVYWTWLNKHLIVWNTIYYRMSLLKFKFAENVLYSPSRCR